MIGQSFSFLRTTADPNEVPATEDAAGQNFETQRGRDSPHLREKAENYQQHI